MDVEIPQTAKADEEVTLKLVVKTELRECMVVSSKAEGEMLERCVNMRLLMT